MTPSKLKGSPASATTSAEGCLVILQTVTSSAFACQTAKSQEKDEDRRVMEVMRRETKRVGKMDQPALIAETDHGFVCAHAGVDDLFRYQRGRW